MSVALQTSRDGAIAVRTVPPAWRSLAALVRRGLRDERRSPLIWGGGLGAMSALMVAIWPSIATAMGKLTESYPAGLKAAFGFQRLDSVERYLDAEMLSLIIPLALAFFAVRCATRATVGAEERGQLDTLLSLPLSRRTLVASSFIVTGLVLAAILVAVWVLTMTAAVVAGSAVSAGALAAGLVNVWPLAMLFAGLATFAGGLLSRPATVTAIAAGTLIAMYVVDLAGKLADPIAPLRAISAFRYYGSAIQNGLDAGHVIVLTLAAVCLAVAGGELLERRDLR